MNPTNHITTVGGTKQIAHAKGSRLRRGAYRLLQRFMTLDMAHFMILEPTTLKPPPPLASDMSLACLTRQQLGDFARMPSSRIALAMAERLSDIDICVAATCRGQLAAYAWYARGSIEAEHNCGYTVHAGTALSFPDHMAFLYNAYTEPEFRGRALYKQINRFALENLKGVQAIVTETEWSNYPALRSCYNLGFQHLGNVWLVGYGSQVFGVYPLRAKRQNIRFGKNAQVSPRITVLRPQEGSFTTERPSGSPHLSV